MHGHYAINLEQSKMLNKFKRKQQEGGKTTKNQEIEEVAQCSIQPDLEYNFKYVDSNPENLIFLKALGHIQV